MSKRIQAGAAALQLRWARPTDRLAEIVRFYGDGLGLEQVGHFENHDGYDGVMFGLPGVDTHLEFTSHIHGSPCPAPSRDNLLVLYIPDGDKAEAVAKRLYEMGYPAVPPENPYWAASGITIEDPDGWRIVLMKTAGLRESATAIFRRTVLTGVRTFIRPLSAEDAPALLELRLANRSFLEPFEPVRPDSFFTLASQSGQINQAVKDFNQGKAYSFGIFDKETGALIGRVNLNNIIGGPCQCATTGYFIGEAWNGRGHATEAVGLAARFAFGEGGLHRLQAGVMPRNERSAKVLEKAGFRKEGLFEKYICINGVWEDHVMYGLLADNLNKKTLT